VAVDSAGNLYIADSMNNRIRKVSNAIITTVAGGANYGFSCDGPATNSTLDFPVGVVVDLAGNVYIADSNNYRIRRLSNGEITTVAGDGDYSFSGDGGPAAESTLNSPEGVALDSTGDLYIADSGNNRIRKVSNGIITTVAGDGSAGFSGDGGPATSASLGGTGALSGGSIIDGPSSIAVDLGGNLYIVDAGNNRIRKVSNGIISTVAGDGSYGFSGDGGPATNASFNGPSGVAVDSAGNIYIADSGNNRIRKVSGGVITTVAGGATCNRQGQLEICPLGDGGPATSASLHQPSGVFVDSAGNIYIAGIGDSRIRKVSNGVITTVAGSGVAGFSGDGGPATSAQFNEPVAVTVDSTGDIYISDVGNNRIRKVSNGVITTVVGTGVVGFSGDGGPASSALLGFPQGLALDAAGDLYIADIANNRIREVLANAPFFSSPLPAGAVLSLSQASGGKSVTAALNVEITTTQNGSIAVPGLAYSAEVTSGGAWLSVSPQNGNTPGLLAVTADPLNLASGPYQGAVTITVPNATPPMRTVNVQFTVTAAIPANLSVDHNHLSFTYSTTSAARMQSVTVSNTGGGLAAIQRLGNLEFGSILELAGGYAHKRNGNTIQSLSLERPGGSE
jgi:sugar lactone lactonase YvrE